MLSGWAEPSRAGQCCRCLEHINASSSNHVNLCDCNFQAQTARTWEESMSPSCMR